MATLGADRHHPAGRYDIETITREVNRVRALRKRPVKAIAMDMWPELSEDSARSNWYKKASLRGSEFNIEELGRVADLLDAPPGWPFIPLDVARHLAETPAPRSPRRALSH